MFRKFRELFGSESLLDAAYDTTITMLEFDQRMYEAARKVLREQDNAELPFDIKQTDRQINKYERQVRRNVLTHLAVSGTANLVPGLALVSIVVDVERIGDYTKNMVDLARDHEERLYAGIHEPTLSEIEQAVAHHFPVSIDVLQSQDVEAGRKVMAVEEPIGKQAESIVTALLTDKDSSLTHRDAVALALYARYLKRINAHLTNIVSGIVNPFPRIGFRSKQISDSDH
jgi:phosphate uptake regulator